MRFPETVHWSDGLFIQPHHLQQQQKIAEDGRRVERKMFHPYCCGVLDYELDTDALSGGRVQFKRLSAVMPDGTEISMPGNARIPALDVSKIDIPQEGLLIHLGLPFYTELEGNQGKIAEDKYAFLVHETQVRDENTGANEIPLVKRRPNVRLTSEDAVKDMELLPVLKLIRVTRGAAGPVLSADSNWIPPFLRLTADSPLYVKLTDLVYDLRSRRDKLQNNLAESGCRAESLSGINLYNVLQLQCINGALARFESDLTPCFTEPFELYTELSELFGKLCALNPERGFDPIPPYDHFNAEHAFRELFNGIRALILAEGGLGYVRMDFKEEGHALTARLEAERLAGADEYYLALSCAASSRDIVSALEQGDEFKLVNPSALSERIRGVKLQELRYPPRCLPSLPSTLWFLLKKGESPKVWNDICAEHAIAIDCAKEAFPQLEAALYITVKENRGVSE